MDYLAAGTYYLACFNTVEVVPTNSAVMLLGRKGAAAARFLHGGMARERGNEGTRNEGPAGATRQAPGVQQCSSGLADCCHGGGMIV